MIHPTDKAAAERACEFLTLPEAMQRIAELEWQLLVSGLEKLAHANLAKSLTETLEMAVVKLFETPGNDALKAELRARIATMRVEAAALQQKAGE